MNQGREESDKMAYSEIYTRINWKNDPNKNTPLGATLLNQMDGAIKTLDKRVAELDVVKASQSTVLNLISNWSMDETTGIITITKLNGEQIIFDLNTEKIPVSFELSEDGILAMTTDDGTRFTADIASMIPVITFDSSDTIAVEVSGSGINKTYSFSIKKGSVTDEYIQPNYLADVTSQAQQSTENATKASEAAAVASEAAEISVEASTAAQKYRNEMMVTIEAGTVRGSLWNSGTAIDGVFTTPTICSSSGLSESLVNDHYFNIDTGNIYQCVTAGTADTAEWIYIGNAGTKPTIKVTLPELGTWDYGANNTDNETVDDFVYADNRFIAIDGANVYELVYKNEDWYFLAISEQKFRKITYGNGIFVGEYNTCLYYSADGITWSEVDGVENFYDVVCGNGMFVAVGDANTVAYSTDGIDWAYGKCDTSISAYGDISLYAVCAGNGMFVAIGSSGEIIYSTDGINWTLCDFNANEYLTSVIYGNGIFVAVGYSSVICHSTDGITWETAKGIEVDSALNAVAYGNGIFVAAGEGGYYLYSKDGISWTCVENAFNQHIKCIAYHDGVFMAGCAQGDCCYSTLKTEYLDFDVTMNELLDMSESINSLKSDMLELSTVNYSSNKLDTWTSEDSGISADSVIDCICAKTMILVLHDENRISYLINSDIEWTEFMETLAFEGTVIGYDGDNRQFLCGSIDGDVYYCAYNDVLEDKKGFVYAGTVCGNAVKDITYGNGIYVAIDTTGMLYVSYDLETWGNDNLSGMVPASNSRLHFCNGMFWATSDSLSRIAFSKDGLIWNMKNVGTDNWKDITYGNEVYVAVGTNGATAYSVDGENWTYGNGCSQTLKHIAYGNGMFVATGDAGYSAYSTDGVEWIESNTYSTSDSIIELMYMDGKFKGISTSADKMYSAGFKQDTKSITDVVNELYEQQSEVMGKLPYLNIYMVTTGWKTSTEYSGYGYVYEELVTDYIDAHPECFLKPASGIVPTEAEKAAYNCIVAMKLDVLSKKLKFYSASKPETNIVVLVKGVK